MDGARSGGNGGEMACPVDGLGPVHAGEAGVWQLLVRGVEGGRARGRERAATGVPEGLAWLPA